MLYSKDEIYWIVEERGWSERFGLKAGLCKILRFWIGTTLDLEPKSVGGDAWSPIQARSHILSFSDLNKPPTSYPPHYNGDVGRGWLPLFWAFRAMGGRVGDSYRASAVKAWGLVILLCRGNPILRDATTPETQPATKNSNISDWQKIIFGDLNRKLLGWKKKGKFEQVLRCFQLFRLLEFSCAISFFECVSLFEPASPNNLHTNGV